MRLGLRDQEAGQPAAVADTWDIDRRKSALVTVLTKSRRRTCGSSGGSRGLGVPGGQGRGDTCRRGMREVHATRGPVSGFRPQNPGACGARRFPGLGLKTRADVPERTGRHVAASGGLRRGEAKDVKARGRQITHYLFTELVRKRRREADRSLG